MLYDPKYPTFLFHVNVNEIGKHFRAKQSKSKYYTYYSKHFFGAIIRTKASLIDLDEKMAVMSVRLAGRSNSTNPHQAQTVTGVKIDIMSPFDDRIEKHDINLEDLLKVRMDITPGVPGNILLNPVPALLSVFIYRNGEGSTVINFIQE